MEAEAPGGLEVAVGLEVVAVDWAVLGGGTARLTLSSTTRAQE